MSDGYYPKYYLKKRQRDNAYRRIWQWIGWIIVLGIGWLVGSVLFNQFGLRRTSPKDSEGLAELKSQLETEDRISRKEDTKAIEDASVEEPVIVAFEGKLEDLEYVSSSAYVHVSVEPSNGAIERDPHEVQESVTEELNEENGVDSSNTTGNDNGESEKPAVTPSPVADSNAGSDNAVEKREVPKEKEKPAADKAEKKEEKPAAVQSKTKIVVYAGYFADRDSAVARKKDLNVLGFPGTIKENGGEYVILVAEVETRDEATVLEKKLEENGFPKAFWVNYSR